MLPAEPTLTAKPVTVREPGIAETVIDPLNVTGTPEAPLRITLPNDFEELEVFKKFNVPVARVPGIDPLDVTVFDCVGEVAVSIRAFTSRLVGSGVPVTATIANVFETVWLFGVIVTTAVVDTTGIT